MKKRLDDGQPLAFQKVLDPRMKNLYLTCRLTKKGCLHKETTFYF